MSLTNKPIWQEGMFVRPQHFQQYDRWIERQIDGRVNAIVPGGYGVAALEFDEEVLALGRIALARCDAVLQEGSVISIPNDLSPPSAREVPVNTQNAVIKLALPVRVRDGAEVGGDGEETRRYKRAQIEVRDSVLPDRPATRLDVGALRARILFEGEPEDDLVCLPIARLREIDASGKAVLDTNFIPPCLNAVAVPRLVEILRQVQALLRSRGEALALRINPSRAMDGASFNDLITLQIVNRYEPLFQHFLTIDSVHPETVYRFLLQLAGELSTYADENRRPSPYPPYDHARLEATFDPIMVTLRGLLSTVIEQTAQPIPLEPRDYGIWIGAIPDRSIFHDRRFVLAAMASMPAETLRQHLPLQIKIGPVEAIRDLVNLQLPGIALNSLPVAPRELPFLQDAVYFELEQNTELWGRLPTSAAFAFHVSGDYPNLRLEFWAIRKR